MTDKIHIFDTTLRDGEQSAGVSFSLQDKLELAELLAGMRVDVIEAGFPAASPAELAAVRAVAAQVRDASVCALARAVPDDVEQAIEAVAGAAEPRIHVFVNSSDVQLAHQLRKGRDEVLAMVEAMVRRARNAVASVELSPMDATRADPDFVAAVVRCAIAAGATVINLPDTVGYALPQQLGAMIDGLYARVPELAGVTLSFHGQDDLGLATANALTAITHGARQVELTANGIGERAGNTSLEEVVMALHVHGAALGVHCDVRTQGIFGLSRAVEQKSGMVVPPNKPVVGRNAFRHASGIHQDGVIKLRETYEVMDPALVGNPHGSEIVLGKLSGRAGLAQRARTLDFRLSALELQRAFERFQALADDKREVCDEDVATICRAVLQARC
jgi:2-isopropylmalate synthase